MCGRRWSKYAAHGQRTAKGPEILSASASMARVLLLSIMAARRHYRKDMGECEIDVGFARHVRGAEDGLEAQEEAINSYEISCDDSIAKYRSSKR